MSRTDPHTDVGKAGYAGSMAKTCVACDMC